MWLLCDVFIASSFGSDITHCVAAGSSRTSPTAWALRNPQLASHFQTMKYPAGFHCNTVELGQYFLSLSPICLQPCTKIHSLELPWHNNASLSNCHQSGAVLLLVCVSVHSAYTGVSMTPGVKLLRHCAMRLQKTQKVSSTKSVPLSRGWVTEGRSSPDALSARTAPPSWKRGGVCIYAAVQHVFICLCASWVCACVYTSAHIPVRRKLTNAATQSFHSFHSLRGQSLLGAQCPVAGQCAALSVIPAHEPDSHHKAPIVFAGRIGSHSACHSAATCISRRHSGACFCSCLVLSC